MIKYTPSKNALLIAQQYLKHEFRKIFHDIKDPKIWKKLDYSVSTFINRENDGSFWNLVAAISDDLRLKRVYYILSSTKYRWQLKKIPISKLLLSGMSPTINKYTLKQFKQNPTAFIQAWPKNKKMRMKIFKTGFKAHPERDHFPILVYQTNKGYRIFDGMRRTLLALIKNKKSIKAWVGIEVNPKGRSLISGGRCHFLANLYEQTTEPDPALKKALIVVGRQIMKNYRNGKETLVARIAGWTYNPSIKKMIKKMTK